MGLTDDLLHHLNTSPTLPFLFIGSGLSRRYLELPDWEELLKRFARLTGNSFDFYRSSANGSKPQIASLIAEDLHNRWWSEDAFSSSREKYAEIATDRESALKIEIAKYIQTKPIEIPRSKQYEAELELFGQIIVDSIITTNYDTLLEHYFPSYKTFVGQDALLFSNPQGIGEIYKIHGSCLEPTSMVLTSKDYEMFHARNPYLAAKLMTFFVEHPIIFMGYSLEDRNVSSIINSIAACLTKDKVDKLRDRLIFINWQPDTPNETMVHSTLQIADTMIPVINITVDSYIPVFKALSSLHRRFSAKLLRQLKEQVYDLVQTKENSEKMEVVDIEDETTAESIEVVFGVGTLAKLSEVGLQSIQPHDLYIDILNMGERFHRVAASLVRVTIDDLLKRTKFIPVFKYLRKAGMLANNGSLIVDDLPAKVAIAAARSTDFFRVHSYGRTKEREILASVTGIADIYEQYGDDAVIKYGALLPDHMIDARELHKFLTDNQSFLEDSDSTMQLHYRRLLCIYDLLAYKTAS